ncbi:Pentatricopeptide repeat-containing protein [Thalictrum thalictroides]|uniref:Pentatricopeptide repeat-containing protein n=1 Tax=Thalictrum thalictroides TaxID=46969 RepID=A0A7J6VL97_THATH|nr:Pentatricopeptide repeat-containing protein [Thalictrum thalictroides]
MLLELEPQKAVNYVLLSNLYAFGGRWEDVAGSWAALRKVAVKKEAGCSWVTMKDGVHVFAAGDKSHPNTGDLCQVTRAEQENEGCRIRASDKLCIVWS